MRHKYSLVVMAISLLCLLSVSYAQPKKPTMKDKMTTSFTRSEVDLRMATRQLWEDHIVYTRNYIVSALAELSDTDAVAQRLLKNQDDIGGAIKPYYGNEAGNRLSALLREHILIATEVVKAAKAGKQQDLDEANKKWGENADDIASFLGRANPYWNNKNVGDMLHRHLELTTGEVVSRLNKNWAADIDYYDRGHTHMLMFADALSDGIVIQFPEKFAK